MAVASAIAILLLAGVAAAYVERRGCGERYRQDAKLTINGHSVSVQKAANASEQIAGLSDRACLGDDQGMLFVFDKPGYYSFWMKDMKFPIDIIWLSSDKTVVYEKQDAQPSSYPQSYGPEDSSQYVLELKAGQADKLGIKTGQKAYF